MGVKPPKVPLKRTQLPASNRTSCVFLVMRLGETGYAMTQMWARVLRRPGSQAPPPQYPISPPNSQKPTPQTTAQLRFASGGGGAQMAPQQPGWTPALPPRSGPDTSSPHGTQAVLVLPIPSSFRVEAAPTPPLKASPGRTGQRSVGETRDLTSSWNPAGACPGLSIPDPQSHRSQKQNPRATCPPPQITCASFKQLMEVRKVFPSMPCSAPRAPTILPLAWVHTPP